MIDSSVENPIINHIIPTGQRVYFFGSRHTNDESDSQFMKLKQSFEEFLQNTKGESVVFIEGIVQEVPITYVEAIRKRGDVGAIAWLAKQAGIEAISPEPSPEDQRQMLCGMFDKELVAYSLIVQNLSAWFHHERHSSFEDAIKRSLDREVRFAEFFGFIPSYEWLIEYHRKLFGEQALEDAAFLSSISNPQKGDTSINKVVAARTALRNERIIEKLKQVCEKRMNIFIVYGKGHLSTFEKFLND